jgi:hypothetical protein
MYNLYALERNSWKARARDRRKIKEQRIETDYLAPDTAEEIIAALSQMERWMKAAGWDKPTDRPAETITPDNEDPEYELEGEDEVLPASGLERRSRSTVLLKPRRAWAAYREMLLYYSLKTLADYLEEKKELTYAAFANEMAAGPRITEWVNLGGQITPAFRVDELRKKIRQGEIDSWEGIHAAYDGMAAAYALDRARHAWEVYRYLEMDVSGKHPLEKSGRFKKELETLKSLRGFIARQVYLSRAKDFSDPFRAVTYRNREEMEQVVGTAGDNSFVKYVRERTQLAEESLEKLSRRL